jgi:hypothetical protein
MHILTLCISNPSLSQNHPNLNNSIFWRISHNMYKEYNQNGPINLSPAAAADKK